MSGLEVVAAVAGIVGAYAASASVYYAWRNKREARKTNTQNQGLEVSLTTGKTAVQREYDEHFARLGKRFAVGDDRARAELLGYVVQLQHTMMTSMAAGVDGDAGENAVLIPNLGLLMATSEDTRKGAVGALAELYQRMEQAKPISSVLRGFFRRSNAISEASPSSLVQRSPQRQIQSFSYTLPQEQRGIGASRQPPLLSYKPPPENTMFDDLLRSQVAELSSRPKPPAPPNHSSPPLTPPPPPPPRPLKRSSSPKPPSPLKRSSPPAPPRPSKPAKQPSQKHTPNSFCLLDGFEIKELGTEYQGWCPCGVIIRWPQDYRQKQMFVGWYGAYFESILSEFHLKKKSRKSKECARFYCLICRETGEERLFDEREKLVSHYLGLHRRRQLVEITGEEFLQR